MRDDFTPKEIQLLKQLRRKCIANRHPLLVLTGNELFYDFSVSETWKELGGRYREHADMRDTASLQNFALATQAIYLK